MQGQSDSLCKSCNKLTPQKVVPASPSILKLFSASSSSPGVSPISKRKNWTIPEDPNQFINQLSFKNEVTDDDDEGTKE